MPRRLTRAGRMLVAAPLVALAVIALLALLLGPPTRYGVPGW